MREGGLASWLTGWRFQQVQPRWSKRMFWLVGLPVWLTWGFFVASGTLFEYRAIALTAFAVFAAVAVVQNYFFVRWLVTGKTNG